MRSMRKIAAAALASTILATWPGISAAQQQTEGESSTVNIKPLIPSPTVIHPEARFPTYYMDWTGTALTLCHSKVDLVGLCLSDPPVAGNRLSETIGFGGEGFWYMATSSLTGANGLNASWEAALEAAFNNEIIQPNDEFTFARIRIRIDTPVAGIYTVDHPYGTNTFTVTNAGDGINSTLDIGGQFADSSGPSRSSITQFLKPDGTTPPNGYLGDPGVSTRVKGSPTNFNRFQVTIAPLPGEAGERQVYGTDLFQIMGKYHTGDVVTALSVGRATMDEDRLELLAHAPPAAVVRAEYVTVDGQQKKIYLKGDGKGSFHAVVDVTGDGEALAGKMPVDNSIALSAEVEGRALTTLPAKVTDSVYINSATYDTTTGNLTIVAESSMGRALKLEPTTVPLTGGTGLQGWKAGAPPARIKVKSDIGGFDVRAVDIIGALVEGEPPAGAGDGTGGGTGGDGTGGGGTGTDAPPQPATAPNTASTPPFTAVLVDVLANDSQAEGAPALDPATIAIGTQPNSDAGTIAQIGPQGILVQPTRGSRAPITFTYTVKNINGVASAATDVTVNIIDEQLTATGELRTRDVEWRITGTSNAMRDNTVTAYLVYVPTGTSSLPDGARRTTIGSATVDPATGGFSIRSRGTPTVSAPSGTEARILLESSKGTLSPLFTFTSRR